MCLSIKLFDRKKTAEEDIIVYKHLLTRDYIVYETPYQNAIICIGETYTSVLRRIFLKNEIDRGLHSFAKFTDCEDDANSWMISDYKSVLVKCIIPKGSNYYFGDFSQSESYASDKLKYVEIINS